MGTTASRLVSYQGSHCNVNERNLSQLLGLNIPKRKNLRYQVHDHKVANGYVGGSQAAPQKSQYRDQ